MDDETGDTSKPSVGIPLGTSESSDDGVGLSPPLLLGPDVGVLTVRSAISEGADEDSRLGMSLGTLLGVKLGPGLALGESVGNSVEDETGDTSKPRVGTPLGTSEGSDDGV